MKFTELAYFTDNLKGMVDFYRDLLDANPVAESEGMAIFMVGSTKLFIHQDYQPGAGELPPENHVALSVDNVDETCKHLNTHSLHIERDPQDYYWGRSAYLRDPDGHLIELNNNQPEE